MATATAIPTTATSARGAAEIVRFLTDHGHRHVFGLPGSSMVAVLHELQNSDIRYVPAIHESVAVAAADGYARVAGSALAFLYMMPGTANGLGNLYNAWRDETPVIVISSQQASTLRTREGTIGEFDLVPFAQPFTRLARELSGGTPVRRWLERARRAAAGPPAGPAFLAMSEDVFEGYAPVVEERASTVLGGAVPDVAGVAARLREAEHPLLVVGGQVRRHGGAEWVERLAEDFDIAVAYEPAFCDRLSIAPGHSHVVGNLISIGGAIAEAAADVVLMVGARLVQEGHPRPQPFFANASLLVHVNADPAKLEETRTADVRAACDPAAFLRALHAMLGASPPADLRERRRAAIARARGATPPDVPFTRALAAYARATAPLHDALDRGWVVDEAVMGSVQLVASLGGADGRRYIGMTGQSLGWGPGAAIGVALASGEPVTCVLGDGAMRFGAQGLWTAAAEKLPITFVVLDNGGYGSTRYFERAYVERLGPEARPQRPSYSGMNLRDAGPPLADLIRGYGVPCEALDTLDDARAAIERAWAGAADGPNAVILPLPGDD